MTNPNNGFTPQQYAQAPSNGVIAPPQYPARAQYGTYPQPVKSLGLFSNGITKRHAWAATGIWFVLLLLSGATHKSGVGVVFGLLGFVASLAMVGAWITVAVKAMAQAAVAKANEQHVAHTPVQPAYSTYAPPLATPAPTPAVPAAEPEEEWLSHLPSTAHGSDQEW
ncbi:hypothetical protein Srot_0897 [Segniliparus rotundus DSM 44985]|uniref:Uncharacterized protein n=1 Tax=Segniliparus rotundus (strain ATCC BAA-972 / CDC 1076 / CIP 108378 / DSM 44985 / JCM 13578) TaxID=640132 RepID=D6ZE94_SEGRD|nr:hypothetical protein [Segniliparus rotundus]ADG97374.1 hypothetical protein Srot_0897 [Segniliparus rotundus DSM 44985]